MRNQSIYGIFIENIEIDQPEATVILRLKQQNLVHAPVVKRGEFLGLVDLLSINEPLQSNFAEKGLIIPGTLTEKDPPYRYWEEIAKSRLSVIPVYSDELKYKGCIKTVDYVRHYKEHTGREESGSLLMCWVNGVQYSISTIAKVSEEHHLVIESLLRIEQNEGNLLVILLFNEECSDLFMNDLQRHNFDPLMIFNSETVQEPLKDRYDELMHYLNV